jgi:DNA-binding transcriptional MerR regulator
MYTRFQICGHFDISERTFNRYRKLGIVAAPHVSGRDRYYTARDIAHIREARQLRDAQVTLADFGERLHAPAPAE